MTSKVLEVTEETFQGIVMESPVPVLLDFWAPWCRPCKAVAPAMEHIAHGYGKRVRVVKVNMDANPNLIARFAVRAIPTVMLLEKGKVLKSLVGVRAKEEYQRLLDDHCLGCSDSGSFRLLEPSEVGQEMAPQ